MNVQLIRWVWPQWAQNPNRPMGHTAWMKSPGMHGQIWAVPTVGTTHTPCRMGRGRWLKSSFRSVGFSSKRWRTGLKGLRVTCPGGNLKMFRRPGMLWEVGLATVWTPDLDIEKVISLWPSKKWHSLCSKHWIICCLARVREAPWRSFW